MENNFYNEYFKRQIPIIGKTNQKILENKKIAIIGAGGLGSFYAYSLSGCGINEMYIVDFDKVSISNIHRQIMFEINDIGSFKVSHFKKLEKRSNTKITPKIMYANNFFNTHDDFDIIIDATDNIKTKLEIDSISKKLNIPFIFTSVDGFMARICLYKNKRLNFTQELKPQGQIPPMVMLAASIGSTLAIKYLSDLNVTTDKIYHIDFLQELQFFKFNA